MNCNAKGIIVDAEEFYELQHKLFEYERKSEKYKWHIGSPVGVVEKKCKLEIVDSYGEYILVTFFPNGKYKFASALKSSMHLHGGYVNKKNIKAWRHHEPFEEV